MTVFPIIALLFPIYHDNLLAVINAIVELLSTLFNCLSRTFDLFSGFLCSALDYLGTAVYSTAGLLCSFFDAIGRLVTAVADLYSAVYIGTGTIVTVVAFLCITFFGIKWIVATNPSSTKDAKTWCFSIISVIAIFHLTGFIANAIAHLA